MLALITAAVACAGEPSSPRLAENLATGLEGSVLRGPIQPVCRVGEPCDAPFSTTLQARQGQQLVARFRSDSAGHYQVLLAPGAYTITADSGAPIWPSQQPHDVTVGPVGLTQADLTFDTGIR
ncbi:MAG: hypothetical protein ACREL4_00385 [Gemmatimonadales bacterium]